MSCELPVGSFTLSLYESYERKIIVRAAGPRCTSNVNVTRVHPGLSCMLCVLVMQSRYLLTFFTLSDVVYRVRYSDIKCTDVEFTTKTSIVGVP